MHGKACLKSGKLFEMEASEELEMEKHLEFGNMIGYLSHNTQDDVTQEEFARGGKGKLID